LVAATVNRVVRCEATQFAVAATNPGALSSDEMRSVENLKWGRTTPQRWKLSY